MHRKRVYLTFYLPAYILGVCTLIGTTGCQDFSPYTMASQSHGASTPLSLSTMFAPPPQEIKFLEGLGTRADNQLAQCRNPEVCNRAHFLKALTALHSNQDTAMYHFQKVMESPPYNRLSQASRVWLWLLDELSHSQSQGASKMDLTRELVQALLERDLGLLEAPSSIPPLVPSDLKQLLMAQETQVKTLSAQVHELTQEVASLKTESASTHSLQQALHAREKKVEELTSQLDALRRIDQELKEKSPPTTPSETILPPKEEPRANP